MSVSILGGGYTIVKKHKIPALMNLTLCVKKYKGKFAQWEFCYSYYFSIL